ncbi:hypothetical protein [Vibrio neonatus]|uniref:hypothetical protein n=1 Tax=Vibrio neonatus TaxID=278860 RepID=UPI0021C45F2A|nr:hypothetical protein [Vibrio neonatus]
MNKLFEKKKLNTNASDKKTKPSRPKYARTNIEYDKDAISSNMAILEVYPALTYTKSNRK